jgi:hypothetical protein
MTCMLGAPGRCNHILWPGKASEKRQREVIPPVCVKYRRTPIRKKGPIAPRLNSISPAQYFLQLAQYVRLPVVSWNADNSALLEQSSGAMDRLQIQLAPTMKHQGRD